MHALMFALMLISDPPAPTPSPDASEAIEAVGDQVPLGFEPLPDHPVQLPRYPTVPASFALSASWQRRTERYPFTYPPGNIHTTAPLVFASACGDRWCVEGRERFEHDTPQHWARFRATAFGHRFRMGLAAEATDRRAQTTTYTDATLRVDFTDRMRWVMLGWDLGFGPYSLPRVRLTTFSGYVENHYSSHVTTSSFSGTEPLNHEESWFLGGRFMSGTTLFHDRIRFEGSTTYIRLQEPRLVYLPRKEWSRTATLRVRLVYRFWVEGSLSLNSNPVPVMSEPSRSIGLRWQFR